MKKESFHYTKNLSLSRFKTLTRIPAKFLENNNQTPFQFSERGFGFEARQL
jgi:hypothetical protein